MSTLQRRLIALSGLIISLYCLWLLSEPARTTSPALIVSREQEQIRLALQAKGWTDERPIDIIRATIAATPNGQPADVLGITVGKNRGFLALFDQKSGQLLAVSKDLATIKQIEGIALPDLPQQAILVRDYYDNQLGGFEQTTWARIFRLNDQHLLEQIFAHVQQSDYYWHEAWDNPDAKNWRRVTEESQITFPTPGEIVVTQKTTRYVAEGDPKTMPTAYQTESQETKNHRFLWQAETLRFQAF
ncbi:hypothetical protein [Heliophilum fasciatum]|uniref:Uncharacterized protein n=1 Tax=Heliophilum fasciatum TaxID=35700 RepID=A0A4R2RFN6_9FIRM|nr:hypothetical protein [Heliophilum fasciatum]MCW2279077.1 hypothetical protein [Heliophilum fasciatum]TCP61474.1 hypothetical protein EDD73_12812 [Heliophilum fasciatum]